MIISSHRTSMEEGMATGMGRGRDIIEQRTVKKIRPK